jgi:hypothetical protein
LRPDLWKAKGLCQNPLTAEPQDLTAEPQDLTAERPDFAAELQQFGGLSLQQLQQLPKITAVQKSQ